MTLRDSTMDVYESDAEDAKLVRKGIAIPTVSRPLSINDQNAGSLVPRSGSCEDQNAGPTV